MTEKLYDTNGATTEFEATVLSCRQGEDGKFLVVLDRTVFFEGGGGQECDSGYIGHSRVQSVYSDGEETVHICTAPAVQGSRVECSVDKAERLSRMSEHGGEHIISALIFKHFGYSNVGFHLGSEDTTCDFNGPISPEQIRMIEQEANETVRADLPIGISYPSEEEQEHIAYRSKGKAVQNLRLVSIGELDKCACCAPHYPRTGMIGLIKIVSCQSYKGGVRLHILCGARAEKYVARLCETMGHINSALSSNESSVRSSVDSLLLQNRELKHSLDVMNDKLNNALCASLPMDSDGCIFDERGETEALRTLASLCNIKLGKNVGVFGGDEMSGYRFVICGKGLKERFNSFRSLILCRGGGSDELICGATLEKKENIGKAWQNSFL